jgi:hypothetical protein
MHQQRNTHVSYAQACAVLGVPRNADEAAIKRAFRLAALRDHPDMNQDADAAERFRLLHLAYRIALAGASLPPPPAPVPPPRSSAAPAQRMPRERLVPTWAFVGLHLTGLVFGLSLTLSILFAIGAGQLERMGIFLIIPGLVVLPDSWSGLYPFLRDHWNRRIMHRNAKPVNHG